MYYHLNEGGRALEAGPSVETTVPHQVFWFFSRGEDFCFYYFPCNPKRERDFSADRRRQKKTRGERYYIYMAVVRWDEGEKTVQNKNEKDLVGARNGALLPECYVPVDAVSYQHLHIGDGSIVLSSSALYPHRQQPRMSYYDCPVWYRCIVSQPSSIGIYIFFRALILFLFIFTLWEFTDTSR